MKVLVLDTLLKQTASKKQISKETLNRIFIEYENFAKLERQGKLSIDNYLNDRNGKKMQGAENIFKYQLTTGDRILYSYGKYLTHIIRSEDADSLVLLGYAKHDDQGFLAKNKNFLNREKYKAVSDLVKTLNDFEVETLTKEGFIPDDLFCIAEILLDKNYVSYHSIFELTDDDLANLDLDNLKGYISDEQKSFIDAYLQNNQPTLLLGGGGTGKTWVALHLLNNKSETNNIYFTQSRELREKVKQDYKIISKKDNIPNVQDINEFCLKHLNLNYKNFIQTQDFISFIKSQKDLLHKCERENITPLDVWAEIRGTLKGSMQTKTTKAKNWDRNTPAYQNDFKNLANLKPYLNRQVNPKYFTLNYSVKETLELANNDENLTKEDKETLNEIIKYFSKFNPKVNKLDFETYSDLSEEDSLLDKTKRKLINDICDKYIQYCEKNNFYDENDLVCKMFEHFGQDNLPQYDFIIIDEVQDYTELQIYLISKMCKTQNGLILAGDNHQMINPTMFSIKRIKELFFDPQNNKQTLQINFLTKNFRCQQGVIDVANSLSTLRRKFIGSQEQNIEQEEYSIRKGEIPFRLEYSKDNVTDIMSEVMLYPSTAVLVPNSGTREYLINLFGKENYEKAKVSKIFTVAEIKGMEYKYVVCFNIISKYFDVWKQILEDKDIKKRTKFRFYFNLIYVALTRAQEHLCFIDENIIQTLEDSFKLDIKTKFNTKDLLFSNLTSSEAEWIAQAKEYELKGKYKEALELYENKISNASNEDITRCEAHIAEQEKDFEYASQCYLLINDLDSLDRLTPELDKNSNIYKLINRLQNIDNIDETSTISLIKSCFYNPNEADKIVNIAIQEMDKYLLER